MLKKQKYDRYRGRSSSSLILKAVIVLLAAVLLVGLLLFFDIIPATVFSVDGASFRLPFQIGAAPTPVADVPDPPVVITAPPTPSPTPAPSPVLHAVPLPRSALYDGAAAQLVEDAGGNAALFDMSADDGALAYVSGVTLAAQAKLSSDDLALSAAILALNQTELYTIARVSCFKNDRLSDADRSLAVTTNSGYRWTDPDGLIWVSPTSETVRQYLVSVCVELAELGFDEILLDNAGYPAAGKLGYIKKGAAYDLGALDRVIDGFYGEVALALADYDCTLSIATDGATVAAGFHERSGQTLTSLTTHGERLWIRDFTDEAAAALTAAHYPAEQVVWVTDAAGEVSQSWGSLTFPH